MIKHFVAVALVAASAATVSPVFASSGYGPAPQYSPVTGAPASQRGQSALTVRAEQADLTKSADVAAQSYGGMPITTSQSGTPIVPAVSISPYSKH
ncbi:hypothetical protein [Paraburkholderia metrosideri]|jgi:hypothetical protein|uniref:DUF4148 domain-containing protein n=1 Tax=Paraburkholderia metrosideri TaxID=580937 RepID=A0ABM8NWW8_9BURK|nr:hypothetical protein [Paraburkholderia metrosideri]CAD6547362.1 hypothetical protein LMG28140_04465 [Paraburkholderia metrosideri]